MSITVAKTAGFCFGVNRAIEIVLDLVKSGAKVYTLGPIIHNPQMVAQLRAQGVEIANEPEDVPQGATLVIRSHGVPLEIIGRIEKCGVNYVDATCPFVSKIHKIVQDAGERGDVVLIAGDKLHPEVLGIQGHCKSKTYVFKNPEEIEQIVEKSPEILHKNVIIVSQTTFSTEIWQTCYEKILEKGFSNHKIFDTICNATAERQCEAVNLSKQSDLMIIIGGRESSNTAKLRDVCKQYCKTYLIETAEELPLGEIERANNIGITAGASTPDSIIKEVLRTMSENVNKELNENFEEMLEESFKNSNTDGKVVVGTVERIAATEIYVDVGRKQFGIVELKELTDNVNLKPEDIVKVGDKLDLLILRTNDQEGTMYLSKRLADIPKAWDDVRTALAEDAILEGVVTKVVKGGLTISYKGLRVFVPRSMASISRDADLESLVKSVVKFKIKEVNDEKRNIIGSIRDVLSAEKKEIEDKFWGQIEVGQNYTGVVKSITNYGAFVDLGGVDGMVHISQLSWDRIKHPSEIVKVGETVNVFIREFNAEKKKISLGYKDPNANPWEILKRDFPIGSVVEGQVKDITAFGAFVRILPSIDGLVHISQLADMHVEKPEDIVKVGETVKAVLTDVDFERKRVSLSIREYLKQEAGETAEEAAVEEVAVADEAPAEDAE